MWTSTLHQGPRLGLLLYLGVLLSLAASSGAGQSSTTSTPPLVLVTGASGYVGRSLMNHLQKHQPQLQLAALYRKLPPSSEEKTLPNNATPVIPLAADLTDPDQLLAAVEQLAAHGRGGMPQAVIHCAGLMDFSADASPGSALHRVNVDGTRNLLTALSTVATLGRQPLPLIVYISSTEVMGGPCTFCNESVSPDRAAFVYKYGRSKAAAEAVVRQDRGFPHVILRPTGIMGPGDFFSMFELMASIWAGLFPLAPAGIGHVHLMYTHIEDVVQAVVRAVRGAACEMQNAALAAALIDSLPADHAPPIPACDGGKGLASAERTVVNNTFIVSPSTAMSLLDWFRHIAQATHRQPPLESAHLPLPVVRAVIGAAAPIVQSLHPATFFYRTSIVDRMQENRTYDNSRARKILGFQPQYEPAAAILHTMRWYEEQRYLPFTPLPPVIIFLALLGYLFGRCRGGNQRHYGRKVKRS